MPDIEVTNPANGEILYRVAEASDDEIEGAYLKAREAFTLLKSLTVRGRVAALVKLQRHILRSSENIVDRIVRETGKSRTDATVSEIFGVLDFLEYLIRDAPKILRDRPVKTPLALMGKKSFIYHDPLGTILVISPWNYPFFLCLVPCLSAIVAGNPVIYKPSEVTPLKGLLEEITSACGFVEGALQVVYGGRATGERLIDRKPAKVLFTGSVATGKKIMERASRHLIPVDLELGGKDPMIVFEDVDIERTAAGALWGAFTNAGQSCTSVERLYVHEKIYGALVASLEQKIGELVLGAGDSGDADVGCMTPGFQIKIVEKHLEDARAKGARIVTGGMRRGDSHFFLPTLVTDVDKTMDIVREETFGPVLPVMKFSSEEEVIREANDSSYGLGASVWSKDLSRAKRVAHALEVGNVSINNVMLTEGNAALPFGGVKNSGFGRYKGEIGLLSFTNIKSVLIDKQSGKIEANWYPYTRRKYELFRKLLGALFTPKLTRFIRIAIAGLKLESEAQKKRRH